MGFDDCILDTAIIKVFVQDTLRDKIPLDLISTTNYYLCSDLATSLILTAIDTFDLYS